jgi:hypothetical protein
VDSETARRMEVVESVLTDLVLATKDCCGDALVSIVLFGSAAEGRLRETSDVNLLILLKSFNARFVDGLREPLRVAHAAAGVEAMFLLADELRAAADLFAVKFNDIRVRHRMLYGSDPVQALQIDPGELRRGLREVLLNLAIRLRERYTMVSLREEQLPRVLAEAAGPLRAAAEGLLQLDGRASASPRAALEAVAKGTGDRSFIDAVALLPQARQQQELPVGSGGSALLALSRLAGHLRAALEPAQP